jgi:hypothetical protein
LEDNKSFQIPLLADDAFKLLGKDADEASTNCSTWRVIPLAWQDNEFPPSFLPGIIILHASI